MIKLKSIGSLVHIALLIITPIFSVIHFLRVLMGIPDSYGRSLAELLLAIVMLIVWAMFLYSYTVRDGNGGVQADMLDQNYLAFSLPYDEAKAVARFVQKYGVEPQKIIKGDMYMYLGPIPDQVASSSEQLETLNVAADSSLKRSTQRRRKS